MNLTAVGTDGQATLWSHIGEKVVGTGIVRDDANKAEQGPPLLQKDGRVLHLSLHGSR